MRDGHDHPRIVWTGQVSNLSTDAAPGAGSGHSCCNSCNCNMLCEIAGESSAGVVLDGVILRPRWSCPLKARVLSMKGTNILKPLSLSADFAWQTPTLCDIIDAGSIVGSIPRQSLSCTLVRPVGAPGIAHCKGAHSGCECMRSVQVGLPTRVVARRTTGEWRRCCCSRGSVRGRNRSQMAFPERSGCCEGGFTQCVVCYWFFSCSPWLAP